MRTSFLLAGLLLVASVAVSYSAPIPQLDYQGKILVNDIPYMGPGFFKYAIGNEAGTTNFWSNDGTLSGPPSAFVTNECFNGVFSATLGAPPMSALVPAVFNISTTLYLRVWFSDDQVSFDEMLPAQKLVSSAYAINSDLLDGLHASQIIAAATNAVTLSGDVSGTPGGGTTVDSLQGGALSIGTAGSGEVLTWNGSAWTNAPAAGGGISPEIASNSFVAKAGDTMTGSLTINSQRGLTIGSLSNVIEIGMMADGRDAGVAVGELTEGVKYGVAVGRLAKGTNYGVAVGASAIGDDFGTAVGNISYASRSGVALGVGAMGVETGVAVGASAYAPVFGVGVGYESQGTSNGVAVGAQALGREFGTAVGRSASAVNYGVAAGASAYGVDRGVAVGLNTYGNVEGVAVGAYAFGNFGGIAIGPWSRGVETNIAIGLAANASPLLLNNRERIAIGHNVTNEVDNSIRVRGDLYLDGGLNIYMRAPFGVGAFSRVLPLPLLDRVIFVSPTGKAWANGTVDDPFGDVQNAYNYAATWHAFEPATLVLCGGNYTNALTMNGGNVHVVALDRAQIASLTITAPANSIIGKQRVHNLVVKGVTVVSVDGGENVKFHNCRFQGGLLILGPKVEVQNCFASAMDGPAVTVGSGGSPISDVALCQSSFVNASGVNGTVTVNANVNNFEMIGCQVVNEDLGPCILDLETGPITPVHLYTHNYLRGMPPGVGSVPAVQDPMAGASGPTIAFTHNTVLGHVGLSAHLQFYANNNVYGLINNVGGPGFPGWSQAGAGTGADASGNIEHELAFPTMPASWND